MLAPDIPVWWRFVDKYGFMFERIYYDAELGGPYYTEAQLKDPMIKMWRRLRSKRADAIVETQDEVWIIEVSQDAGLRAIGQVLAYRALWLEDPQILKPERLLIVCQIIDEDTAFSAAKHGIQVYVV